MKYIFDSNTVSDFYDIESAGHANLYERVSSLKETDSLYVSILMVYGIEYGYANAPDAKKRLSTENLKRRRSTLQFCRCPSKALLCLAN